MLQAIFRERLMIFSLIAVLFLITGCTSSENNSGDSDSGSSGEVGSNVTSLEQIPDMSAMMAGNGDNSASLTSPAFAVIGTPPNLIDIEGDDADELFWDGVIADINENGADPDEHDQPFWDGESKCRAAQHIGYAFSDIEQSGNSLCYMKKAPAASGGVTTTADDPDTMFDQEEETKTVRVDVSGFEDEGAFGEEEPDEQNIFIRVYGSETDEGSDGYAVDLWFCFEGQDSPVGLQQIRINNDTGAMTQTDIMQEEGWRASISFEGQITEDSEGNKVFDSSAAQTATVLHGYNDGQSSDVFKSQITIEDGEMAAKAWSQGESDDGQYSFGWEDKTKVLTQFSGSSLADFKLLSASIAQENSWTEDDFADSFENAIGLEFQTSQYVDAEAAELFAEGEGFGTDSFWSGELEFDEGILVQMEGFSCSANPDEVATMDMSNDSVQAEVVEECEQYFEGLEFCDSEEIDEARNALFEAYGDEE